jgi:hypothetical protein
MADSEHDQMMENRRVLTKKVDTAGWGIFFLWIGIAWLAKVGWGVGLLGVGLITLGGQAARQYSGLSVEATGLVVGILFVVGGVWKLLHLNEATIPGDLAPILCVVVGGVLLVAALLPKPKE